jgi:predicted RND superfamily exporter protein
MSEDGHQIRFDIRVIDSDPNLARDALLAQIRTDLIERFDLLPEQVNLSGMLVLYNNVMQSLVSSMYLTMFLVFAAMMVMFAALFRSWKMALVGPAPTLVAAVAVLGAMGLAGLPLDIMTMTIAAITIGIGVHDTIHYTHRFEQEIREGRDYLEATHITHLQVGRAMIYTSVIIIGGFSILTLSNFMPTIYFGVLTGVAMVFALLSNLTLLPLLLQRMRPFGP